MTSNRSSKIIVWVTIFTLVIGMLSFNGLSFADEKEKTEVTVTDFEIKNEEGQDQDVYDRWEKFKLKIDFDASMYGKNLKEGDYFNVKLPDNMRFPTNHDATHFDIKTDDGTVFAKAEVVPGDPDGGTIKVTFTDYVESHSNNKGSMWLNATFGDSIQAGQVNEVNVTINGTTETINVNVNEVGTLPEDEVISKWPGEGSSDDRVKWSLRLNYKKGNLKNVKITDVIQVVEGDANDIKFIPDSFQLVKVDFTPIGEWDGQAEYPDISDKLTFNADKTSFELDLGDTSDSYILYYETTYKSGIKIANNANVKSDEVDESSSSTYVSANSDGTGSGDLLGKIQIIKVDGDDDSIKLEGVKFKVKSEDGTFEKEYTTDENGEILTETLEPGKKYIVEELEPLPGYLKVTETQTLEVQSDKASTATFENFKKKIEIPVEKVWVGKKLDKATIKLLADGTEVESIDLNEANSWKHTFKDLPQYKDGKEIVYTIEEPSVEGYTTVVTGDAKAGFTVTNTIAGKVSVPVEKVWVGKKLDKATIKLLADGTEVESIDLNEANSWKHTFKDLPQYKDGKEIVYTIEEPSVEGYDTKVEGDAKTGFTVTNTNTEKLEIPVEKKWVGPAKDKVKIRLFKNGSKVKTVELNEANSWKYTFTDLPKYDANGNEIGYYLNEDMIEGYDSVITGDMHKGFIITNTIAGKVSVPVEKVWVGKKLDKATIKLLADGTEVESIDLNEANSWKHTFIDLPQYKDGKEIVYTIEEPSVEGYDTKVEGDAKKGFTVTNTQKLYKLGDFVWYDNNKDGLQDKDSEGVEGVKVVLKDAKGNKLAETVTDANGKYIFEGLENGMYTVEFSNLPEGYEVTTTDAGSDDKIDSDGLTPTGEIKDADNLTLDLGIVKKEVPPAPKYKLGDYVWYDDDKDGIQDSNEKGVEGVKVVLTKPDGTTVETTTDENGYYVFEGLDNGNYKVEFSNLPEGYEATITNAGSDDLVDSDGLTPTGEIKDADNMTLDLGIVKKETLPKTGTSNTVYYTLISLVLIAFGVVLFKKKTSKE